MSRKRGFHLTKKTKNLIREKAMGNKRCLGRKRFPVMTEEEKKKYRQQYYMKNIIKFREDSKIRAKELRQKDRIKYDRIRRKSYLKRRYNITFEQLEQMKTAQDNRCAICGNIFKDSKDTHIDHDHKNHKTRQLLCMKCNFFLGYSNENLDTLQKAIEYLKKWRNI